MSLSLRAVLPHSPSLLTLPALPRCAGPFCPRPPTLWQRWWSRREGIWLQQDWYCSSDCFQEGLYRQLQRIALSPDRKDSGPRRLPLGLLLLSQGDINQPQLWEALQKQRCAGTGRLGEWLVSLKAVSEQQVTAAVATQQGCPVFAVCEPQSLPERMSWPRQLMERFNAIPVFHNPAQSTLYVGFLAKVDYGFLFSLERMFHCRTEACIVPASSYRQHLERRSGNQAGQTIAIQERQSSIEMTRTIACYAQQVRGEHCTLVRCHDHLWIRLEGSAGSYCDFLFRTPIVD